RRHLPRRPVYYRSRDKRESGAQAHRDRIPVVQSVPAYDGGPERDARAGQGARHDEGRGGGGGGGAARQVRARGQAARLPRPAVRRPAAAGGDRPCAGDAAAAAAARRGDQRARPGTGRRGSRRHQGAGRRGNDDGDRDARDGVRARDRRPGVLPGGRADRRGGAAGAAVHVAVGRADPEVPAPHRRGRPAVGDLALGDNAAVTSAETDAGRTQWLKRGETPLREFLRTETGSALVLATATAAALIWANISSSGYASFWGTPLVAAEGRYGLSLTLHEFVNSGLMAFFFLVVGLEARREFDMGELRVRSRLTLPVVAGLGGMLVPICVYLGVNAGRPTAHGWGMAMSTDTAFALGALALVGRGLPDRVRTYLLTFSVVDDLAGIAVIAIAYSGTIQVIALLVGICFLGLVLLIRWRGIRSGILYLLLGVAAWVAFFKSGVDPVVAGLVLGLLSYAYPASRASLEEASDAFRLFREQPTAELAQAARDVVRVAISPNDRLEQIYHPWTSYLIVPLFALANAGIVLNGGFLARAYTSPVTLGIMIGYLAGKPLGTIGAAWLVTRVTRG